MKPIERKDLKPKTQYICTYEYDGAPWAITFIIAEGDIVMIANEESDFVESEYALDFTDKCTNIQFWSI